MNGENTMSCTHVFEWHKRFKRGVKKLKMSPRVGGFQQVDLSSRWGRWWVKIVNWLFKWPQLRWTWKKKVFGRLSPMIWVYRKSTKIGAEWWSEGAQYADIIKHLKTYQTCIIESSLAMKHGFLGSTSEPSARVVSGSHHDHILQYKEHYPQSVSFCHGTRKPVSKSIKGSSGICLESVYYLNTLPKLILQS